MRVRFGFENVIAFTSCFGCINLKIKVPPLNSKRGFKLKEQYLKNLGVQTYSNDDFNSYQTHCPFGFKVIKVSLRLLSLIVNCRNFSSLLYFLNLTCLLSYLGC